MEKIKTNELDEDIKLFEIFGELLDTVLENDWEKVSTEKIRALKNNEPWYKIMFTWLAPTRIATHIDYIMDQLNRNKMNKKQIYQMWYKLQ